MKMKVFGLIGFPLGHSFSEKYFRDKFVKEKISDCDYQLFPLQSIDEFTGLIQSRPDLAGLSVTIPYKEKVIPFLSDLDETAKAIGAVNCIRIIRTPAASGRSSTAHSEPRLIGYNTDAYGFSQSIKPFLESRHQRALILGAGGAAKAVEHALRKLGVDTLTVVRKPAPTKPGQLLYSEVNKNVLSSHLLIVNTTPLGTFPDVDDAPAIPYEFLGPDHLLYDLVYNPPETLFLKSGKARGAQTLNGLKMLELQADRAFEIFNCSD